MVITLELKYIEAFLTIVEKDSFSAAASELNITQPTISIRIQHLEQELNVKLFKREKGTKITLTSEGEQIYPYFKEAFTLINKGSKLFTSTSKMKIACPNHMGVEIVPELLKVLYDKFPHIEFEIKIGSTLDLLRKGEVDFGFAYIESKESYDNDLTVTHVANENIILVCAPEHPLAKKDNVSVQDLKEERIIVYNRDFLATKSIEKYLQKNGLNDLQTTEISNLGWMKMMVRKGLGIAFLYKMIVKDELINGKLVNLPFSESLPSAPIYLCFKKKTSSELRKTVISVTQELLQDY